MLLAMSNIISLYKSFPPLVVWLVFVSTGTNHFLLQFFP